MLRLDQQTVMSITMKYHVKLLMPVLCIIMSSCAAPYAKRCAEDQTRTSFSVTISKGVCFGQCPMYSATVYGDGSVEYNGERFVDRVGVHTGTISPEDLCAILTEVEQRKLMQIDTSYVEEVPDAPMTKVTISYRGRSTTVLWNLTTPEQFRTLQSLMVKATHENPALTKAN